MEKQLTVVADVHVKSEHVDEFKQAVAKILEPSRQEAGNLRYDFCQSLDNASQFVVFEYWESEKNLQDHLASPHMTAFFDAVGPVLTKATDVYHAALTKI